MSQNLQKVLNRYTYIELGQKASKKTILCIEMKYTEQPKTEDYIGNNNADYRTVAEQSNLFVNPKDIKIYESRGFGQMVRNILLAESMMQNQITGINEYRSIILYPKGNSSYVSAIPKFTEFLKDENSGRFGGLTYEDLFSAIRKLAPSYQSQSRICKWVDYLESRYIVK